MSIANELSSEVAVALLTDRKPEDVQHLLDLLLAFHSAMRDFSTGERAERRSKASVNLPPKASGRVAAPNAH